VQAMLGAVRLYMLASRWMWKPYVD
jgi:hypothetical protein